MTKNAVTKMEANQQEALLPADPMVSMIERVAMDPNADIEKLERMLAMKERMEGKEAEQEFASAFARASVGFPTIPLNGKGHNNKPYATLKDITSMTRPVLAENGLALTFEIDTTEQITVTAVLMHRGGHSKRTSIKLPSDTSGSKNAVQAVGSTQTYGQRYTAQAILGLSLGEDTDDDGRSSGDPIPGAPKNPSWAQTITQDMDPNSTPRDKAEAVADALCAQWGRKKSERQLFNEWDRRCDLIDGENGLESKHPDLHEKVVDAYEQRIMELKGTD